MAFTLAIFRLGVNFTSAMLIDLRDADAPHAIHPAQVCIVGAGITGLTLAHQLHTHGIDVLLVEAGGLTPALAQNLDLDMEAELQGIPHDGTRASPSPAFGGSALVWGGQLLPLSPDAVNAVSPLPVSSAELARYSLEAEKLLHVDDLPFEAPAFFTSAAERGRRTGMESLPSLYGRPEFNLRISKFAPFAYRNLAVTLGRGFLRDRRMQVLLHARVTELLPGTAGNTIAAAVIRTPAAGTLHVRADHFVLAAGTLQTVRLLLASRSASSAGVGNGHDQVGRNVHDHLTITAANLTGPARAHLLRDLRPWVFGPLRHGTLHSFKLEASPALRRDRHLLPTMAHLTFDEPEMSGLNPLRQLLRTRQANRSLGPELLSHLSHLPSAGLEAARHVWSAARHHRRFVSPGTVVSLRLNTAQQIPSSSSITLSDRLDSLGHPLPILDWHVNPAEIGSLQRFAVFLREQLETPSVGPGLTWHPDLFPPAAGSAAEIAGTLPSGLTDARHLMGGACLGTDPRSSVVNPDLAVHEMRNLSVASPAVLPDGAAQLPTLTLMALTLRLADHLAARLRR